MAKKLLLLLILFFVSQISFGQSNLFEIDGLILDPDSKIIKNTHIVNLSSGIGTVSDSEGKFTLKVKLGDWLQITNIQFYSKKERITIGHFKEKTILIYLLPIINQLDEVEIKKRMTGFLNFDRTNEPEDSLPKIDKGYYDFSKMDFSNVKVDENKAKSAQYLTDPVSKVAGLPPATIGIPDYSSIRKKALRKELNFKKSFPERLKELFSEQFFYERLKIPKDNYYHFLDYCNSFGIEDLYKKGEPIEILKILLKESKSYLLLLENNK
jgi:hypothetical protein